MTPLGSMLTHLLATAPAGGAEIKQVVIATAGATIASLAILVGLLAYKAGRFGALAGLAKFSGRVTGLPGWASLPGAVLGGTLLIAVFGMYWDISIHIDDGRDPGPLANPAHYFILVGLFGVLLAGVLAMALPRKPTRSSLRIAPGWFAPVGALLITACGAFSLMAFPLDDVWHRLFGQDVTLWGPTHLMLIGGAGLSIIGAWALQVEGTVESESGGNMMARWREFTLAGALLIGLSTFQGEFDFSVPQFRLIFHPITLMFAASIALVAARIRLGRGGAFAAVAVFALVRGGLALVVGGLLGHSVPHFPLYIAEAAAVELVAAFAFRGVRPSSRPIAFGAAAGVGVGTLGLAGEWGWSHVFMTIPWPPSLFPDALILGLVTAVAGGVIGGFVGRSLTPGEPRSERAPRWLVPAAALAIAAVVGFSLPMNAGHRRTTASFVLTDTGASKRAVSATVRINPPDAARDAEWFNITSWQGKEGRSHVDTLKRVGPGAYVSRRPIQVHGAWKTTLRLAKGREVVGLPVFLPRDTAIPGRAGLETPASPRFTRAFALDKKNLQREQKKDVPPALTTIAYLAVLAIYVLLLAGLAWGLLRLERTLEGPLPPAPEPAPSRARKAPESARPSTA